MTDREALKLALEALEIKMRCKYTKRALPAIWKHPDLDGQCIAAFTRDEAWALVKAITLKDLDKSKFTRTGEFGWRPRMLSTDDDLSQILVTDRDMEPDHD